MTRINSKYKGQSARHRMPWFRFWNETVNNAKVQTLPDDLFRLWVNMLCIASSNRSKAGIATLPPTRELAFGLHISKERAEDAVNRLVDEGLLVVDITSGSVSPKDWEQWQRQSDHDKSSGRMQRLRQRKKGQVTTCDASHDGEVTQIRSDSDSKNSTEGKSSLPRTQFLPVKDDGPCGVADRALRGRTR